MATNNKNLAQKDQTLQLDSRNDADKICGKCSKGNEEDDSFVRCGECKTWFHSHCSGLLEHLLDDLVDSGEKDYICYTCLQLRNRCKWQKADGTKKQGQSQSAKAAKGQKGQHKDHGDLVKGADKNRKEITNRSSGKLETVVPSASEKCKSEATLGQSKDLYNDTIVLSTTYIRALTDRVANLEAANTLLKERVARLELQLVVLSNMDIYQGQSPVENGDATTREISDFRNPRHVSPTGFDTENVQNECAIPAEYMFRDHQVKPVPDSLTSNAGIQNGEQGNNNDHLPAKQHDQAHMYIHPDDEQEAEILLIGDENIKGILPQVLHEDLKVAKHSALIIQDAALCLRNTNYSRLKCLVLHVGMNDIRITKSADNVIHNYDLLISKAQRKYPYARIILSLIPPWKEISLMYKRKQVNDFLWDISTTMGTATCVDNENLGKERPILIKAGLYQSNGILLNTDGMALLASNLKKAIDATIEIAGGEAVLHDNVEEMDLKLLSVSGESVIPGNVQHISPEALLRPGNELSPGFVSYTHAVDGSFQRGHVGHNMGPQTSSAQQPTYFMPPQAHPYPPLQPSPIQAITVTHTPPMQQVPVPTRQPMPMPMPMRPHSPHVRMQAIPMRQPTPSQPMPRPTFTQPVHGQPPKQPAIMYVRQSTPGKSMPMMQHVPMGKAIPMGQPLPVQPKGQPSYIVRHHVPMGKPITMGHPTPMGQPTPIPQPPPIRQPIQVGQPVHVGQPLPMQPMGQPIPLEQMMTGMHPQ
ncbi:PREDICTED: uncharacterized protein LOC109465493 [Branchiostoma belcheri]|uniref:Uncharacterized protein LOC109465493 n=1 Tax=Branchiostoma belcheri TaxID=7741 RepID=A0A6P4YI33_BRABE|nr:PREDICTED: uncharacterized protein LOC109465493 [Branchiostoma belcheri]